MKRKFGMTKTKPDHTFVVLAYGQSPYLEGCLESLKKQTELGKVLIATSTPNQLIDKLSKKYGWELRINKEAKGIASDWNFALRQAKTKYTTLAHQDDIYFPEYLELMWEAAEKAQDSLLIFSDYEELVHDSNNAEPLVRNKSLNLTVKRWLVKSGFGRKQAISEIKKKNQLLRFGSPIPCPAVMYNMKSIASNFKFSTAYKINMDWDAWQKLADAKGEFVQVNKILMQHRIHLDSATSNGIADNSRQKEDREMFARFWPKPLTFLISKLYSLSYASNEI